MTRQNQDRDDCGVFNVIQVRTIIENYTAFKKAGVTYPVRSMKSQNRIAALRRDNSSDQLSHQELRLQKSAPLDLDLISWPPRRKFNPLIGTKPKGYLYDQLGGLNTYIYIIDTGIDLSNAVSKVGDVAKRILIKARISRQAIR